MVQSLTFKGKFKGKIIIKSEKRMIQGTVLQVSDVVLLL